MGTFPNTELQVTGEIYPDSSLDNLLRDLPLDQATGADDMHGAPPFMHTFHRLHDICQKQKLLQQEQPGASAVWECYEDPVEIFMGELSYVQS